jgi:hypothetical protein
MGERTLDARAIDASTKAPERNARAHRIGIVRPGGGAKNGTGKGPEGIHMAHSWKFVRIGGFDQVEITTGADLEALPSLDQKLWVALSCPVAGVELEKRTLELLDLDKDGRIRAPELIAAVKWACAMVKDADDLVPGKDGLALASIDDESDEGKLLLATAKTLLKSLGKGDAKVLTVDDASKATAAFDKDPFNGDGVLPAASADKEDDKKALVDAIACTASPAKDRSGEMGMTKDSLAKFFEAIDAHAAWLKKGSEPDLAPLGDATADAYAALTAVRAKIDDYFARVKVAAFDPRALAAVNGEEKLYLELAAKSLDVTSAEIEKLPIAIVAGDRPLTLGKGVNPAWAARIAAFRSKVVAPIVGDKDALSETDWSTITAKLAAHHAWKTKVEGESVAKLGKERVLALAEPKVREALGKLLGKDEEKAAQAKAIESVEKLARLHRDLMTLVNNFVCFRDFYSRKAPAMFQAGTLYLDQRACELTVRVADAGKHATMAPLSNSYLVYCDCRNAKGETMSIAAAVTAGDVDNLMVGRNGIFYDRKGADWDATITKIVENPISVRQAFWSPYKKVLRTIETQIAARAAAESEAADASLGAAVEHTHGVATGAAPPAPPPRPSRFDVGTVAALGVAVGGITAALGAMLNAFFGLGFWMPLGVVGLILCISGPSMAVAWLKLRKRNLGPILDANGWAVNAMALVNVPLGSSLTKEAVLPPGSARSLVDPFEEKRRPWGFYVFVLLLLAAAGAWYLGRLDGYLPEPARSTHVLGENAPAWHADAEASDGAAGGAAAATPAAPAATP